MGALTDFFVAAPDEIAAISGAVPGGLPIVQAKRADPVKLESLSGILGGDASCDLPMVRAIDDEGPWIFELPAPLVELLGGLSRPDAARAASAWAKTEEWEADGGSAKELTGLLESLSELARRATGRRKLYLWMSL